MKNIMVVSMSILLLVIFKTMHCQIQFLEGTPCPIRQIESDIKTKLSNLCSSSELNHPDVTFIDWKYINEPMRLSSPFTNFPRKQSNSIMSWKQHLSDAAYKYGYSDNNPYFNQEIFFQDNLYDHIALNGISKCRDIDITFNTDENGNKVCLQFKQAEVLEIIRVGKHFRIPSLDGTFAVRAKKYIPKNTILGRFCGDELYAWEYNKVYEETCEYTMRNHYRMSMKCPNDTLNNISCPSSYGDNQIVLDELDPFPANPMVIINDCRKNISSKYVTDDDRRYWNAEYHHVYVNGWPFLFIVSTKPIFGGQEITCYYGPNYVL
eukprot:420331_1